MLDLLTTAWILLFRMRWKAPGVFGTEGWYDWTFVLRYKSVEKVNWRKQVGSRQVIGEPFAVSEISDDRVQRSYSEEVRSNDLI